MRASGQDGVVVTSGSQEGHGLIGVHGEDQSARGVELFEFDKDQGNGESELHVMN